MKGNKCLRFGAGSFAGLIASAALIAAAPALAQDNNQASGQSANKKDQKYPEIIEEIVTIGTPGGSGVQKQEASFAVNTIDPVDIAKFSPKSTADLFKSIPGVWAESSGGVSGANIDVRGLPGGGDAPFVTLAINGTPIYGTEMLSFMEQSTLFRIDDTIESVQALRGGPNAVFGKGEPGVTVNFNLKRGHDLTEGRVKYTTSDYGLQRLDGVMSGALTDNLYYMIGGYTSSAPGIRDPQFTAEKGKQFTINLTREFDNGEIDVFARATNDHGQWLLPFALNTGNNLGTFSPLGNSTRLWEIQVDPDGNSKVFDFGKGRGWDGVVAGGSAEFDFGDGWTFRDQFTMTSGNADTYGFVPAGGPVTVADLSTVLGGLDIATESGRVLSGSDWAQTYGHWVVQKDLEAKINDISIKKQFGDHDLTFGYYQASWSSNDWWSLGNPIAIQNIKNGEPIVSVDNTDPNNPVITPVSPADIAAAGGDAGFAYGLQSAGDARTRAFYLADSWYVTDQLRIDGGIRSESIDLNYVADTGAGYPDGSNDVIANPNDSEIAWTLAGNYDISDSFGVYARYSDGYLFPHFDKLREGNEAVNGVKQLEAGIKYNGGWMTAYATAYHNTNDNFSSTVGAVIPNEAFQTRANGIEGDLTFNFGGQFTVSLITTLQNAEITKSTTASNEGNRVLRQPDFQARISPAYDFDVGQFHGTVYGAYTMVGERYGDNANSVKLPSFNKLDLGVMLNLDSGFFFQLHGDNLNNSHGITEGDPRNPTAPNGRPILGRSINFSVGYDFGE